MARTNLVEYLQTKISEYLSERKYQTLMTLSERSGVPYNTLRRVSNGKVDKPTLETSLAILKVVEPRHKMIDSVTKFYPELGKFLAASNDASMVDKMTDQLIDGTAKDPVSYWIFSNASTRSGTTEADIKRLFGTNGIQKLRRMMTQLIVYRDEKGIIRSLDGEYYSVDADTILAKLKYGIEFFDQSLLGTEAAGLTYHTASLNQDGLKAIKKTAKDFYFKVAKIKNDEKFAGNIPFYANILMGLVSSIHIKPEEKNV